jgi:hypothetical protein
VKVAVPRSERPAFPAHFLAMVTWSSRDAYPFREVLEFERASPDAPWLVSARPRLVDNVQLPEVVVDAAGHAELVDAGDDGGAALRRGGGGRAAGLVLRRRAADGHRPWRLRHDRRPWPLHLRSDQAPAGQQRGHPGPAGAGLPGGLAPDGGLPAGRWRRAAAAQPHRLAPGLPQGPPGRPITAAARLPRATRRSGPSGGVRRHVRADSHVRGCRAPARSEDPLRVLAWREVDTRATTSGP